MSPFLRPVPMNALSNGEKTAGTGHWRLPCI